MFLGTQYKWDQTEGGFLNVNKNNMIYVISTSAKPVINVMFIDIQNTIFNIVI